MQILNSEIALTAMQRIKYTSCDRLASFRFFGLRRGCRPWLRHAHTATRTLNSQDAEPVQVAVGVYDSAYEGQRAAECFSPPLWQAPAKDSRSAGLILFSVFLPPCSLVPTDSHRSGEV